MSASKKKQIEIVIRKLTDQLAIAQTELSLIQSYDENGKILPDIKMEEDEGRILVSPCVADDHYGMLELPIHYSLGCGVPEALGDDVDKAVYWAFQSAARNGDGWALRHDEMEFKDYGLAIELYWREHLCVCLHLELVHTDSTIDREEFEDWGEYPPDRALN
jgi:hypothetical protein